MHEANPHDAIRDEGTRTTAPHRAEGTTERFLAGLTERLHGALLRPGDDAFEDARQLWNGVHRPTPLAIARCRGAADVALAVDAAREARLPLAVRGGGHGVAGDGSVDGGLVIDLAEMNAVEVDPATGTVRAQGGATIGDLDRESQAAGLAVPMGVMSATGIAGLTLRGGMGWLRRAHGLACDALIAATLVTADGRLVRASEAENPELLWGLRGGGGGLGVVTSFEYRAVPLGPEVAFNVTFYPRREARRVFHAHEAFLRDEPGRVSTLFALGRMPAEGFPDELHGQPFAAVLGMYAGEVREGVEAMRPLREICEPLADLSDVVPYVEAQRFFDDDYPDGMRYYWKSTSLAAVDDRALDVLLDFAERTPSDLSTIDVWRHGGAMSEPAAAATAYGRRDLPYLVNGEANWEAPEDDEANIAWVRACLEALRPYAADHLYLNFPGFREEGEAQERAALGENHARLERLRARYDPGRLFRPGA